MARPRKPTNTLIINGAFDKNPNRRRADPSTHGPVGDPPRRLNLRQKQAWREIVACAPEGVLTDADRHLVETLSKLLVESWTKFERMGTTRIALMTALLGRIGMTPADRSKVAGLGNKPPPANPFLELMR